ncbi:RNA polymerase III subunit C82 [Tieghemiomyces parasiticus]|uniref:DNA-directed RNA polymerase III subunit RPC3 n=1 Tax=Tieghemiomyces parasiticus TaxID=78921 RepID=A0A9W8DYZ0_9FUNG|nr:RNA polymerase III subunit C82 [Tieghemiomyces parasiticus]
MRARKGRLPLRAIAAYTQLKLPRVREGLVVLIQHNLATWAEAPDGRGLVVFYELSIRAVLYRLRLGDVLQVARDLFDQEGQSIVQHVLLWGNLTPTALQQDCLDWPKLSAKRRSTYMRALQGLIRRRYLTAVQHVDTMTADDRAMVLDAEAQQKLNVLPSAAELARVRRQRLERSEAEYQEGALVGMKRKIADDGDDEALKVRVGSFDMVEEVDLTMAFRVNLERFTLYLRNRRVVEFVHERTNRSGALVVQSLLGACEDKMRATHEELSPPVGLVQITQQLPKDQHIAQDIDLAAGNGGDSGYDLNNGSSTTTQDLVRQFLDVLRADTAGIVFRDDLRGSGQFRVSFVRARQQLFDRLLYAYLNNRFGTLSCRVLRILHDKGRLDDRQLAKLALLPVKDLRRHVHELLAHRFVQLQEIPKTAERTPSTCFYLFFASPAASTDACLALHYQEIGNLYARITHERKARTRLIAKTQREDVRLDPSLLSSSDRKGLDRLEKIMDLLEVCILRLDRQVLVIRDI